MEGCPRECEDAVTGEPAEDSRALLAVACEPWEINLLTQIIASPLARGMFDQRGIVIADTFTLIYYPDLVAELLADDPDVHVWTLDRQFDSWQLKGEPRQLDGTWWDEHYGSHRDFDTMLATHQGLASWENEPMFLSLTDRWRRRIADDILKFAVDVMDEAQPDLVIGLERRSMVGNAIYEVCRDRGVPMRIMISSRVGYWWHPREDLGLGTGPEDTALIDSFRTADRQMTTEFADQYRRAGTLYPSRSGETRRALEARGPSAGHWLRVWGNRLVRSGRRSRRRYVRRLDQDFLGLTRLEMRMNAGRWALARSPIQSTEPWSDEPFVLWPLHTRPEDSVSVLGLGLDEIKEIRRIRSILPSRYELVVKENPAMVGLREKGFKKQIESLPGVRLVDPRVHTAPLLEKSCGVVSLSGTALLEAAVIGKPAWALGRPEFEYVLDARGPDALMTFIKELEEGVAPDRGDRVEAYLRYLRQGSSIDDLPWEYEFRNEDGRRATVALGGRLLQGTAAVETVD
jgi:hypothetical protein